jgi:hypothetical protein
MRRDLISLPKWFFMFEFPQNLMGFMGYIVFTKILKHSYYMYHDTYIIHVAGRWGAISLSRYIFADDYCYRTDIIKHEYGHRKQSQLLLFLYIFVIGFPSLIWRCLFSSYRARHNISYYCFYTEVWANRLGGYRRRRQFTR